MNKGILTRTTFRTSRTLEFFSERELTMQLGVSRVQENQGELQRMLQEERDKTQKSQ